MPNFGGAMSRTNKHSKTSRVVWLLCSIMLLVLFIGCGEMEETVKEEEAAQPPAKEATVSTSDSAQNEDDAILTSFIGPKEPDTSSPETQKSVSEGQAAQYEKQIQDLQTENASLKQKLMRVEQENRNLTLRLSDTESKLALERERADRAEAAAKAPALGAETTSPAVRPTAKGKESSSATMTSYEDALRAFNQRKYETALRSFRALLDGGISEDLSDNCLYWIGESQFALKKYYDAIKSFKEVLTIPRSEKKADAQFMIAQCYDRLGKKAEAKEAYEQVVKNYPMSKHVKRAKQRWAQL